MPLHVKLDCSFTWLSVQEWTMSPSGVWCISSLFVLRWAIFLRYPRLVRSTPSPWIRPMKYWKGKNAIKYVSLMRGWPNDQFSLTSPKNAAREFPGISRGYSRNTLEWYIRWLAVNFFKLHGQIYLKAKCLKSRPTTMYLYQLWRNHYPDLEYCSPNPTWLLNERNL